MVGSPLAVGVEACARGADSHHDTVAGRALQLCQHPQYLSVFGRDAVFSVHSSSGADDIATLPSITSHREVVPSVHVNSHQVATRVSHVHFIEQHVRK
jgi:hypothetical protein